MNLASVGKKTLQGACRAGGPPRRGRILRQSGQTHGGLEAPRAMLLRPHDGPPFAEHFYAGRLPGRTGPKGSFGGCPVAAGCRNQSGTRFRQLKRSRERSRQLGNGFSLRPSDGLPRAPRRGHSHAQPLTSAPGDRPRRSPDGPEAPIPLDQISARYDDSRGVCTAKMLRTTESDKRMWPRNR
jgi:hypothetical protein